MAVVYSPSDVQELLGVDSSTLRKYATLLEGRGYPIHRNNRGHRGYFEKDVATLQKLMEFSKQEGLTIEQSVEAVMVLVAKDDRTDTALEVVALETTNDREIERASDYDSILERIDRLEQINVELISLLKEKAIREAKQEEMLNRIMKYVARTEQLEVERMKVQEETRMQIAASIQRKWWKWWK